jgi:hypothetical protein
MSRDQKAFYLFVFWLFIAVAIAAVYWGLEWMGVG